jgi:hypothetical protein
MRQPTSLIHAPIVTPNVASRRVAKVEKERTEEETLRRDQLTLITCEAKRLTTLDISHPDPKMNSAKAPQRRQGFVNARKSF